VSKIYLKTYCYAPHEVEFIEANLRECYPYIEKMIVCEFDINHTGMKREFIFQDLKERIDPSLVDKLDYHACSVYDHTVEAYDNEPAIHQVNEPVMRSWFTKLYNFEESDIILSVDADEIIMGDKIPYIIDEVKKRGGVSLKMRQFFYKKTYMWKDKDWLSPMAAFYGLMNPKYPNNWRDIGNSTSEYVGGHFSWCMTAEQMVHKLHTYSHPRYRFCADLELLNDAIENKKYPFDPNTKFDIEELSEDDERIPKSMRGKTND
tara:strand:- start:312 stop:1097 length:786 start_codon:yes stop_codon:yes gene_type:complete